MRRATTLVLLAVSLSACDPASPSFSQRVAFETRGGIVELRVALASSEREREHGLMGRPSLPSDAGMAFAWNEPTETTFWMRDTLIPLSIAFVGTKDRIVAIREMTPCRADPCPVYRSPDPYSLAIEVNAGWFTDHGVRTGDVATVEAGS